MIRENLDIKRKILDTKKRKAVLRKGGQMMIKDKLLNMKQFE